MLALKVIFLVFFECRLSRPGHIVQTFLRLGQAGEIDIDPGSLASLDDVLFGIPRSIDLALVGVHVAVEPDFQITFLGFGLAEMDELLNGHVGTVARIVLSRKVTAVYTGFETGTYEGNWPFDNCPWYSIHNEVLCVSVVDTGIKPLSMAWWFNQFARCESFDLGNIDTSECVSLERLFSSCGSVATADLRGLGKWDTGNVQRMDACFDGMRRLTEIPGISCWRTESCVSFSSAFYNCTGLQRLDISHWSNRSCKPGPQSWGYVPFGHSGGGYPDLECVKIGASWDHVGDLLRNTYSVMKVTGANGNWYALSDGNAYSSSSVPDNKADTYYTTKALLDQVRR